MKAHLPRDVAAVDICRRRRGLFAELPPGGPGGLEAAAPAGFDVSDIGPMFADGRLNCEVAVRTGDRPSAPVA